MRKLVLLALLLPGLGMADTLLVTWVQPTARVDGTPLPLSEIQHYRMVWSVKGVAQPDKVVPVGTSYTLDTGALAGKTCLTLATVDTDGLESVPSNMFCRNAKPNPPSNMVVR